MDVETHLSGVHVCVSVCCAYTEPTIYTHSNFGDGKGPIVYSQLACIGWETSITDCSKSPYASFSCPRSKTAGVLCHDSKQTQPHFQQLTVNHATDFLPSMY